MKNKKLLIYLVAVIIIGLILYITAPGNTHPAQNTGVQIESGSEMPAGHPPVSGESPNKSNVNADVFRKMENLKEAVQNSPNDTLKLKEYADILSASHKIEEAKLYYLKVLAVGPERVDILEDITNIFFMSGNYTEADKYNSKILQINKDNTIAIYNAGAIAATIGNKEKARKYWQDLIKNYSNTDEAKLAKKSIERL